MNHLSELLLDWLSRYHRGKRNAVPRERLLRDLRGIGYRISDRELRAIYAELPVCTREKGLFYPETRAELEECREYYRKAALSLLGRWRKIAQSHPDLIDAAQGELF